MPDDARPVRRLPVTGLAWLRARRWFPPDAAVAPTGLFNGDPSADDPAQRPFTPGHSAPWIDDPWPADLCLFGEPCCTPSPPRPVVRAWVLNAFGSVALATGIVGTVVPLLPTTPFILVAVWAFARSSPRLHGRLIRHPRFGPLLDAWRARRAIPASAKVAAAVTLPLGWVVLWLSGAQPLLLAAVAVCLAAVGGWILTRPS